MLFREPALSCDAWVSRKRKGLIKGEYSCVRNGVDKKKKGWSESLLPANSRSRCEVMGLVARS